jgi:hypothetical protein
MMYNQKVHEIVIFLFLWCWKMATNDASDTVAVAIEEAIDSSIAFFAKKRIKEKREKIPPTSLRNARSHRPARPRGLFKSNTIALQTRRQSRTN